jgi:siroheme synthase-like protein
MGRRTDERHFQYYPAFLDLVRKRVVVVGGGEIATGKVLGLLPCGPEPVVVIAPEVSQEIRDEAAAGRLEWCQRPYQVGDLAGADYAFAATDDRTLNAQVAAEARCLRVPVLAVDDVPNCDFIAPSVVRRGNLIVAASTGGRSPAFARWLRERLECLLPRHWGDLLEVAGEARERLAADRARIPAERWQASLDEELENLVQAGELTAATDLLLRRLAPWKATR